MKKPYFFSQAGDPEPLCIRTKRRVRFEEVDSLSIVWHGRYPSFFEDGRVDMGLRYGIGYMDFYRNGVVAPIRKLHFDFYRPLKFQEEMTIVTILHWSTAARINFEYRIETEAGEISTTGYSVQMMLNLNEEILVLQPKFYMDFCNRWKVGCL